MDRGRFFNTRLIYLAERTQDAGFVQDWDIICQTWLIGWLSESLLFDDLEAEYAYSGDYIG